MKKILLGLVMLVTAATMNAQIELEYVFDGEIIVAPEYWDTNYRPIGFDNMYLVRDEMLGLLHIYTEDGLLYKSVKDPGYNIITNNVFKCNSICICKRSAKEIKKATEMDPISLWQTDFVIYDAESLEVLNEFSHNCTEPSVYMYKINGNYKLVISANLWEYNAQSANGVDFKSRTYIYSCPGNGEATTSVENVPAKVKRNAYPNPASDLVILPYDANGATSMKIYDMQGKLVERKFLDKSKQELQLNVKDYPSGMYFFEVNGESNSFIVK